MTDQSHNFDPAKAMEARADVVIDVDHEDADGEYWEGQAFFLSGGEWELPDSGPSFWAADVEFIGAVLRHTEGETMIVHGHEGAMSDWMDRAMEIASAN